MPTPHPTSLLLSDPHGSLIHKFLSMCFESIYKWPLPPPAQ